MKFEMNRRIYTIKFVTQQQMYSESNEINNLKANYFGKFLPYKQEIWLSEDLSYQQSLFTLVHELTHCYIWTFCTDIEQLIEEDVCHINSNSFFVICEIITKYINKRIWEREHNC